MNNWIESVYSDGSEEFVSSPSPKLFENVKVRVRMYQDAPVRHVLLRWLRNGAEQLGEAKAVKTERGLTYYEAELYISENRIQYQFYLVCDDVVYFYTQHGITTYVPDHTYDFVLLADYEQPAWVKEAVFYQIFPERFYNGDLDNDVRTGEYKNNGWETIRITDWNARPKNFDQSHCLDFYGGDLSGIQKKLPYLKELGVTALYVNPIFVAPSVHKYDCIDFFHVDPHFGGDEALAALCKAVHENGMRLILDISINHTGIAHRWFNRDGDFFPKTEGAYNNPDAPERAYYFFGESNSYHGWMDNATLPTLNYTSQALREIIFEAEDSVLKKWLKPPYSIDGWRFDVADVFARNDNVQLAGELWPRIRQSIRAVNPQAYILAEDWGDCASYLQGDAWDSPMNYYGCGRVIRQFLGECDLFMERNSILRKVRYKMTAQDVQNRVTQHLAKLPWVIQENQFNLFDSHDVSRLHNNASLAPNAQRAAAIFQFILVGAASIYYGDEAGIDGELGSNEGCRYPMPWHDDFSRKEPYRLYHTLTHCKAAHKSLSHGGMKFLLADGNIVAIARFTGEEAFVAVVSTEDRTRTVCIPFGTIGAVGPKGVQDVLGTPLTYRKVDENSIDLTVEANQAYLMQCQMKPIK